MSSTPTIGSPTDSLWGTSGDDHRDDASHRPELLGRAPVEGRPWGEEIAEQLARAVEEMDEHRCDDTKDAPEANRLTP